LVASPEHKVYTGYLSASTPVYYLNVSHYVLVPLYAEHNESLGKQPVPLVTQLVINVSHSESEVAVTLS